mmetsp:Transcript_2895/g.4347  ORF Transcript_2895/g.4347 Transcript_2895/m.4347 type:complete len:83 (+) Transcript_2895:1721-1969(+)
MSTHQNIDRKRQHPSSYDTSFASVRQNSFDPTFMITPSISLSETSSSPPAPASTQSRQDQAKHRPCASITSNSATNTNVFYP